MLKTLALILPILLPSWRFFKAVEPSPRVQWAMVDAPQNWHCFRPRPERVSLAVMLGRLFWNPCWNQTLYVVSCAERLHLEPNTHSAKQIAARVARDIAHSGAAGAQFRFRLVFVQRVEKQMIEEIVYISEPFCLAGRGTC